MAEFQACLRPDCEAVFRQNSKGDKAFCSNRCGKMVRDRRFRATKAGKEFIEPVSKTNNVTPIKVSSFTQEPEPITIGWVPSPAGTVKVKHFIVPDTQCKPGAPQDHLYWAGRYAREQQPDVIIHLGDHWDMESLSSYEGKGSKYFEGKRVSADIAAGNAGLELFEKGLGGWQPKRKVLLRGNHEDRITRAVNTDPRLEGLIDFSQFNDIALGWEVFDFKVPVDIDGVSYAHFFYQRNTGNAFSGSMDNRLRTIGHSFTQGHQQGLAWGRRELANGTVHIGLVAGSFYQHWEGYRGPQATTEWRGVVVKHEVANGDYDPMFVSLDYLHKKFSE